MSGPSPTSQSTRIATPYEGETGLAWDGRSPIPAPLRLHRTTVTEPLTDYNNHLSESAYLLVFGDSSDAFFRFVGIDEAYRSGGHSLYTVQTHLHNRAEAAEGDELELTLRLLDTDDRRLHLYHEMLAADGTLLAAAEQLLVHVDTRAGRVVPMPADLARRIDAIVHAHAALAVPALVGRPLGIRREAG